MAFYKDVTLLITHYNRSASLERLLAAFVEMDMSFAAIIVSDDCSKPEHLEHIRHINLNYNFKLIEAVKNGGLGNNINKGQHAVLTKYTLYVQEDFVPTERFPKAFADSLLFLDANQELDMARYYAYFKYPYLKPLGQGFSEMYFPFFGNGYRKFYAYSDHPHLRRSNFIDKFGPYREDLKSDATEYTMMMNFLKRRGKSIFYEDFKSLFDQRNSEEEPSTVQRSSMRTTNNIFIASIRHIYRYVKFYKDYLS